MKEKEFLSFVSEVMNCSVEELNMDTAYGEYYKWDSLMHLNLIMETEEQYGVSIPIDNVNKIRKLSDLFGYIK